MTLPGGLPISIGLTSAITQSDAVGSLIQGRVADEVKDKKRILIPSGASVRGRIRRMEHYPEDGGYFVIGLEFTDIEWGDSHARFVAEFLDMDAGSGGERFLHNSRSQTRQVFNDVSETRGYNETIRTGSLPGVGTFFIRGRALHLPAGFKTIWKTSSLKSATP